MEKRTQPPWHPPISKENIPLPNVKLFNSLTSKKELFVPINGKEVKWYTCGPTVYDVSHMGHARTYISLDILRRVLRDYFMFDVKYVLNVTDVDDKIIKRARQNYLMSQYSCEDLSIATLYTDISKAIRSLKSKSSTDPDPDKREYYRREYERLVTLLSSNVPSGEDPLFYLLEQARDAIAEIVDQEYGASITDPKIFVSLARKFEQEFHADMHSLNVLEPDVLVRVTEFIKPITEFIQKIVENGYGYVASSGSVYFDTNRFANDPKHFYAKLVPTAFGDVDQLATGEGDLTSGVEKRSPNDFALWKASKPGEPSWPSPWGDGRPGWHIECSALASSIFGESMDIHAGGADLKFPHHDNELAQSEAYFGHSHWVNYFLHSGHLTISGCKMSKSLKNFITIRDALKQYSARRLRLTFLLHSWRDTMDYSPDTVSEAISYEKTLIDFLYNATSLHLMAAINSPGSTNGILEGDRSLNSLLMKTQRNVYDALCDSCDTRRAMAIVKEFIGLADQYALCQVDTSTSLSAVCNEVYAAACFVLRLFRIFGVADRTSASVGTAVPVGAMVANGVVSSVLDPDAVQFGDSNSTDFLQRSWLSLDSPTIGRLALAVHGAVNAAHNFADSLIKAGGAFAEVANSTAEILSSEFGIDISKSTDTMDNVFTAVVGTVVRKDISSLDATPFSLETEVWPVVFRLIYRIASMRQSVRTMLLSGASLDKVTKQGLLNACDRMRDEDFVLAGIRLQDRTGAADAAQAVNNIPSLGLVDPDILAEEVSLKLKREAERRAAKDRSTNARINVVCQPPSQMFLDQLDKYSRFDEKGMPTHDASGKEIAKSQLKKLQKRYETQAKRYAAYLESLEK